MSRIAEALRVNFGCGDTRREGYVGVDVRKCGGADYVLPAWDCAPFEPDSVDEAYSRHMLEHLDPADARRALTAWLRILRPGGVLRVIVPDLIFHARQLLSQDTSWTKDPRENLAHALAGFYGWRDPSRGGDAEDAHRWGYTWESLSALLRDIGYAGAERVKCGTDSEAWHLHVTAYKGGTVKL
jgi:SAM-dependent methyltransferase